MSENTWQETRESSVETPSAPIERAIEPGDMLPAREGLPRNFRMRADRHYVDQLAATSADQPVRMLPLAQLECTDADAEHDLRPLIESIRANGVVHPLLVRRRDAGFAVVAGHKRLRAARALRLPSVPCIVRDLTDPEAAAIASADNVTAHTPGEFRDGTRTFTDAQRVLAAHLSSIRSYADMCAGEAAGLSRPALDMLRVHTWRANAVLHALDLLAGVPAGSRRERSIAGILDDMVHGFEAEARFAGVTLRTELRGDPGSSGFNEEELRAVLASALLASLPVAERAADRMLVVKVSTGPGAAVAFEIVLPGVSLPRYVAAHFFDVELADDRPGGHPASIGALAAKMFAGRHNGTAAFEPFERGYRLTITLPRKS